MSETVHPASAEQVPPEGFVLGMPGEGGFYVPTDLHEQTAIQQASIRAAGRIRQPKIHIQLNRLDDGRVVAGPLSSSRLQATLESRDAEYDVPMDEFHALVDRENLNSSYASELKSIYDYFQSKHMPIDPLRVVNSEVAKKAYEITGRDPSDAEVNLGIHLRDRSLVVEHDEGLETFGRDYILGAGLHEAAHSVFSGERTLRTYTETGDSEIKLGWTATSGLVKADLRREAKSLVAVSGQFFNEASADLTRVRALREMGRSNDLNVNANISVGNVAIVTKPNAADRSKCTTDSGTITMPAEYSMGISTDTDGHRVIATPAASYAAYALDLMDAHSPGLYDDLMASARDHKRQAAAIRKIEAIKPGLYRQLSELSYSDEDFAAGLRLVVDAIEPAPETAQ